MPLGREKIHTPRIGAHTSTAGGLHLAIERGAELGCDVVQIFTKSNQQWAAPLLTDEALESWESARRRTGVEPAMAHAAYLINLAAAKEAIWQRSLDALVVEYERCRRLRIPYLVVHPGAHMGAGEAAGLERVVRAIDRLHDLTPSEPTRLLLENTAGQGSCVGNRFEHLRDVLAAVRHPERLGVCLDTCHLLAAGYDIRTREGWAATIDELERTCGTSVVRAFHVNDAKRGLGSRLDRHEHIGRGAVGLEGFRLLVNDPRFAGLPMAIETPKSTERADPVNLALLHQLVGKKRVGPAAQRLLRKRV
jgi:deoxyribonuclease IV